MRVTRVEESEKERVMRATYAYLVVVVVVVVVVMVISKWEYALVSHCLLSPPIRGIPVSGMLQ